MLESSPYNQTSGGFLIAESPQEIVVAYAKVIEDKDDGIYLQGVFFGGIATTKGEAEQIARECVNSVKGGTILPKLIMTQGKANVLQAMEVAGKRFAQLEVKMFQAEEIYQRTQENQARARAARRPVRPVGDTAHRGLPVTAF